MFLTIAKVLLVAFLIVSVAVLVARGIRRSRANRTDPRWARRHQGQPGHEASIRGVMPFTPLPDPIDPDDPTNPP